jgi:hypothetical protein
VNAVCAALDRHRCDLLLLTRRSDHNATSGARKAERHRAPKPSAAAGDNRDAIRKRPCLILHAVLVE